MKNLRPRAQRRDRTETKRFFIISPGAERDGVIVLAGPEFHHCTRVCRVRAGETVSLIDGRGGRYEARLDRIGDGEAVFTVISRSSIEEPLPVDMAIGVIKAPRFELAVEKCTELGARTLIPFTSARCVWRKGARDDEAKLERIRRKVIASCKQSGQSFFPEIDPVSSFDELTERFSSYRAVFLADQDGVRASTPSRAPREGPVLGIVGPEGGLSPEERGILIARGAVAVSLGLYRLRTETAAICLLYRLASEVSSASSA